VASDPTPEFFAAEVARRAQVERTLLTFATAEDGLAPLGDYLQELDVAGKPWTHLNVMHLIYNSWDRHEACAEGIESWFRINAATPTPTFARAIAAVLMGGVFMPDEPGGVVRRCQRPALSKDPWRYQYTDFESDNARLGRQVHEQALVAFDTETSLIQPAALRK
jgi:hypothetical protein